MVDDEMPEPLLEGELLGAEDCEGAAEEDAESVMTTTLVTTWPP